MKHARKSSSEKSNTGKKRTSAEVKSATKYERSSRYSAESTRDDTRKLNIRVIKEAAARKSSAKTHLNKKKSKKNKKYIFARFAAISAVSLIILSIALAIVGAGMYAAVYYELDKMNVKTLAMNSSSVVCYTDKDGNIAEETHLHYQGERRIWVESSDISIHLKNAAVAIEDERFYTHNGVDFKRTAGATVGWVLEKVGIGEANYGGSTLTQQLVKNITNEKDKSVARKVKEMMRAVALENQIDDKDKILTMYLNISYFGNQCNGVEAAANLYFAKSAKDVTPAEAATIVGITQRPAYFDPIKNPDNALSKRNVVLAKMNELGYLTDEEYEEAKAAPLGLSDKVLQRKNEIYSYFVDAVISDVINDLMEENKISYAAAEQMVYNGGLKIYTTMDKDVQSSMEDVYENRKGFNSSTTVQSAMVVLDPNTGEVKGLIGGAGEKTEGRGLNRATQSPRQPGSAIKPISVYAPGIDTGKLNSATVICDDSTPIKGDWSPSNAYSGHKGDMVLSKCVEVSSNVAAAKALKLVGIDTSYDYAKNKFHLSDIVSEDRDFAPLSLGGLTNGVTVIDMAGAYGALANGGMYNKPHTYTKVEDSAGEVLLEYTPKPQRAVSKETAFIMTDILADVITGDSGTGRSARLNNMPAYGKTGTTNDNKDKWFAGYTEHYVGVVWFGCDKPTDLRRAGIIRGDNPACVIWKNVMNEIHDGLDNGGITAPESVKKATLCSKTGNLASSGCVYAQSGYFAAGNIPTRFCKNAHGLPEEETDGENEQILPTETEEPNSGETEIPNPTESPEPIVPSVPESAPEPSDDDDVVIIVPSE